MQAKKEKYIQSWVAANFDRLIMSFCWLFAVESTGRLSTTEGKATHSEVYSSIVPPLIAAGTLPIIPWKGNLKHLNLMKTWKSRSIRFLNIHFFFFSK